MGCIKLKIKGKKGESDVMVKIDSGARRTFVRKDVAEKICTIDLFDNPDNIKLGDGKTVVQAIGACNFVTEIDGKEIKDRMDVLDMKGGEEMYLGALTLEAFNLNLKFRVGKKGENESFIDMSEYEPPNIL